MSDSETCISTHTASELLGVHESSVKRWCNASELACRYTQGGHRRIPLDSLLDYARDHGLEMPLLPFGSDAEEVWSRSEHARRDGDYQALSELVLRWLIGGRAPMFETLLLFLRGRGFSFADVADSLVALVLRRIGDEYVTGRLSIGDEHHLSQSVRDVLIRTLPRNGESKTDEQAPVALVGCARGVTHEIGALLTRHLLEWNGWQVVYLGADVPTEEFASLQRKHNASLVCISVVPPVAATDALAISVLLEQMYDAGRPYALVFGGSSIDDKIPDIVASAVTRIETKRFFTSLAPFEEWIRESGLEK